MANFVKLKGKDHMHDYVLINMDLVLEIVPPRRSDYGCRLIFSCVDSADNDYMYCDVMETPEEILGKI